MVNNIICAGCAELWSVWSWSSCEGQLREGEGRGGGEPRDQVPGERGGAEVHTERYPVPR